MLKPTSTSIKLDKHDYNPLARVIKVFLLGNSAMFLFVPEAGLESYRFGTPFIFRR